MCKMILNQPLQPKLLCKIDVGDWVVRDACQCLNESTTHRFPVLFRPFVDTAAEKSETVERKATESEEAEPSTPEEVRTRTRTHNTAHTTHHTLTRVHR